jgi:hypothetical protein
MGGIWESGVKLVKSHLRKILGVSLVTYEVMYTLLTCIEACFNSRPITPMSNDPLDFEVLTPGHLLIGESLTAPVETSTGQPSIPVAADRAAVTTFLGPVDTRIHFHLTKTKQLENTALLLLFCFAINLFSNVQTMLGSRTRI